MTAAPPPPSGPGHAARAEVLARVRTALGRAPDAPAPPPAAIPRAYRPAVALPPARLRALFTDRLRDYHATVHHAAPGDLPGTLAAVLTAHGTRRAVVPPGLDGAWLAAWSAADGAEVVVDSPELTPRRLDRIDSVVTCCAAAVAETGTIILDAGPDQGRRMISLIPDHHVCVVPAERVVASVPEAVARLDPTRPLTWISGPSATSDIELNRVEGVHGPRHLDVVLLTPPPRRRRTA